MHPVKVRVAGQPVGSDFFMGEMGLMGEMGMMDFFDFTVLFTDFCLSLQCSFIITKGLVLFRS